KAESPQLAALYALALDSGMRRAELGGLKWTDLDLARARVKIERQLISGSKGEPVFGPVKNKTARTIEISPETVALLRQHRGRQPEERINNGASSRDHGLVFAKPPEDRMFHHAAGDPIQVNHLNRDFKRISLQAGVRLIKLHGTRHTCATLML